MTSKATILLGLLKSAMHSPDSEDTAHQCFSLKSEDVYDE